MSSDIQTTRSPFVWNRGGWFGSQFGCTAWMLPYSAVLLFEDPVLTAIILCGFCLLNLWGISMWRRRHTLPAFAAMIRWMFAMTVFMATIVVIANIRGVVEANTPFGLVSTRMPYSVILIPLVLMLFCALQERFARHVEN